MAKVLIDAMGDKGIRLTGKVVGSDPKWR